MCIEIRDKSNPISTVPTVSIIELHKEPLSFSSPITFTMAFTLRSLLLQVLTLAAFIATAGATDAAGTAFLEQKAQEPGVVATGSGLLYKIIKNSASPAKSPLVSTPTVCHYKGTLIDGTEFDSSFKRGSPATFAPNQVIKGWTEAMQLMKEVGT